PLDGSNADATCSPGPLACLLVCTEEKQLVFNNRAPNRATKNVETQLLLWRTGLIVFPAICIHRIVAEELKSVAMKIVGARLDAHVRDSTGHVSKFRRGVVGFDLKLGNSIDIGPIANAVIYRFIYRHTIEKKSIPLFPIPIYVRPGGSF